MTAEERSSGDSQREARQGSARSSRTEWAIGILSSVLVLLLLGFLFYEALTRSESPPAITLRVEQITRTSTGQVVEIVASNRGGTTAAAVRVQALLLRDGTLVETSSATLSYVPARAEREGGVFFRHDPRLFTLQLRPLGYERP